MSFIPPKRLFSRTDARTIPNRQSRYKRQFGSAISEYALAGAGIVILSIMGLTALGSTLRNVFHDMMRSDQLQPQIAANANAKVSSVTGGLSSAPLTGANASAVANNMQATVQSKLTQTSGANGITNANAQSIADAARQALTKGEINQTQYDLVMQLANKGHEMADIEAALKNAYDTNNGTGTIIYNGQNYTQNSLSYVLDQTSRDFGTLLNQSMNSIQQSQPDSPLLKVIPYASAQIGNLETGIFGSVRFPSMQAEALNADGGASTATNQGSASICTAGQHLDSGNHCTN